MNASPPPYSACLEVLCTLKGDTARRSSITPLQVIKIERVVDAINRLGVLSIGDNATIMNDCHDSFRHYAE
jgi:hypothetical protein